MNRAVLLCTLCAVLSSSWLENVDAQLTSEPETASIVQSIETLSKVVEGIQNSLSNLQATVDELKNLLIKSSEKEDEQLASLSNLEAQSNMQTILLNEVGENLENQTSLLNNFLTKEEIQVNNLTNVEVKATTVPDSVETLPEVIKNSTASNDIVEAIIAGTSWGVVIIPLDTREPRKISSDDTEGLAFNWQSRKVYWIVRNEGIMIADIDGSDAEILISDSNLKGLAVDQITGNLYYGVEGSNSSIRVCDSMGNKCVTIASADSHLVSRLQDIALFPSEGIMFWSNSWGKSNKVTRANMDGTNATEIISEFFVGLYSDELTGKLYWANLFDQSIENSDYNGNNRNVLLNTTIEPRDIALDGDTLYFGGYSPHVYSVTGNGEVSSIAKIDGEVYHIAFFGRNKAFSRPNPCKDSPCTNLCVLNRVSYTCL